MTDGAWLVADLGGTNARFALADPDTGAVTGETILPTSSGTTLVGLITGYLRARGVSRLVAGSVAIACPRLRP